MTVPKMTELFTEAPLDWKKSFKKAQKTVMKHAGALPAGAARGLEVPKGAKPPPEAKPIRGKGGPHDDPLKTVTTAEMFETEAGSYYVSRGVNGRYYCVFVDSNVQKARDLGEHPSRKEALDAVLADHDKTAAGIGEAEECEGKETS